MGLPVTGGSCTATFMRITRTVTRDGSLLPRALDVIRRVPDKAWTHGDHDVLHPRVAYTRAFSKVALAWQEIMPALATLSAEMRFDGVTPNVAPVEIKYGNLLHALYEHIEACYAVIRCIAPPTGKPAKWHQQAVRAQKIPGAKTFDDYVIAYRALCALISDPPPAQAPRSTVARTCVGFCWPGPRPGTSPDSFPNSPSPRP
jgi:hypothetical protein